MSRVTCDLTISLDGFVAGPNQRISEPLGDGGELLHRWMFEEAEANAADPVLNLIEWEVRRKTLIADRETRGGNVVYRFDIHLQGPQETVFFDI